MKYFLKSFLIGGLVSFGLIKFNQIKKTKTKSKECFCNQKSIERIWN